MGKKERFTELMKQIDLDEPYTNVAASRSTLKGLPFLTMSQNKIINEFINTVLNILGMCLQFSDNKKIRKMALFFTYSIKFITVLEKVYAFINSFNVEVRAVTEFELFFNKPYISKLDYYSTSYDSIVHMEMFNTEISNCIDIEECYEVSPFSKNLIKIDFDSIASSDKDYFYTKEYLVYGVIKKNNEDFIGSDFNMSGERILLYYQEETLKIYMTHNDMAALFLIIMNTVIIEKLSDYLITIDCNYVSHGKYYLTKLEDVKSNYNYKLYTELSHVINNSLSENIKTGVLIYGDPGIGKSATIKKLFYDNNEIIKINIDFDDLMRAGAQRYISILNAINCKKILFIDDLDMEETTKKTRGVVELLTLIDSNCYDCIISIINETTMHKTIKRSGRFDVKLHCNIPEKEEVRQILKNIFSTTKEPYMNYLDIDTIDVSTLDGFTHADLANIRNTMLRYSCSFTEAADKVKEYMEI